MSSCPKLDQPKICTRIIKLKKEQNYSIERTGLVKRWKILTPNIKAKLYINNTELYIDNSDINFDGINFDIPIIRNYIRNLIPMDENENILCNIEGTLLLPQIKAMEHYAYFPLKLIDDFIFTGDIMISFEPSWIDNSINSLTFPDTILIEEEYILSKVRLCERLKRETLEDIDKNNKE